MQDSQFLGLPGCDPGEADIRLLPLPFEGTVSYGQGTSNGPAAILRASTQIELWDDELDFDLESLRFHTAEPIGDTAFDSAVAYLRFVEEGATALQPGDGLTIGIGGEHSLTPPLVHAACQAESLRGLTIIQFDAHADLRDEYDGARHSHACAMRRLVDVGAQVIAIGIRSFSREEAEFARDNSAIRTYRAQSLANDPRAESELSSRLHDLHGDIYITVDIDGLDCSLCPATGTPEPGGLSWWQVLRMLRAIICEAPSSRLIGCDVVETVPMPTSSVNEFTAARLIAKLAAYVGYARRNAGLND